MLLGQVLDVFGCALVGVSLQQAQEDQVPPPGRRGTTRPAAGSSAATASPCSGVPLGGTGVLDYVTWGAVTKATRSFQWHCCGPTTGEAWAVVSEDWVEANGKTIQGLDLDQLMADLKYVPQG